MAGNLASQLRCDDIVYDVKPEPRTAHFAATASINSIEPFKEAMAGVFLDSRPLISHSNMKQ